VALWESREENDRARTPFSEGDSSDDLETREESLDFVTADSAP
jgi:hypothetical protein